MASSILILGIGNYLMGDEGLGVHLASELASELEPGLADVMDGGTAGFQLMEYLESYPHVILIDATLDGQPSGTIHQLTPRFAHDFPKAMSTHEIGLKDLVEGLSLLGRLPEIHLFVMSIEKIQPMSTELSIDVKENLPLLKKRVVELLQRLTPVTAG